MYVQVPVCSKEQAPEGVHCAKGAFGRGGWVALSGKVSWLQCVC